jgi:hypothetical protein
VSLFTYPRSPALILWLTAVWVTFYLSDDDLAHLSRIALLDPAGHEGTLSTLPGISKELHLEYISFYALSSYAVSFSLRRLLYLEKIFGLGIGKENSHLTLRVEGKTEPLPPEQFL